MGINLPNLIKNISKLGDQASKWAGGRLFSCCLVTGDGRHASSSATLHLPPLIHSILFSFFCPSPAACQPSLRLVSHTPAAATLAAEFELRPAALEEGAAAAGAAGAGVSEMGGAHWFAAAAGEAAEGQQHGEQQQQGQKGEGEQAGEGAAAVQGAGEAVDPEGRVLVCVTYTVAACGLLLTDWQVDCRGALPAAAEQLRRGLLPSLPRVGVHMGVATELDAVRWLGGGPHECYPDRKFSALLRQHHRCAVAAGIVWWMLG